MHRDKGTSSVVLEHLVCDGELAHAYLSLSLKLSIPVKSQNKIQTNITQLLIYIYGETYLL